MSTTLENPKKPLNYLCEKCNFNTCNKKDYARHLSTDKHLGLTNPNIKKPQKPLFSCICGKTYRHSSSLCSHKKTCSYINNALSQTDVEVENPVNEKMTCENLQIYDLVKYLMKENTELKNMMMEQNNKMMEQQNLVLEIAKNGTNNTINTHTNSHNKAFNLNFFLNETCKDAMNITEFIESLKLQVSDLESVGELGYIEGISNIIVKNLQALDVTQRPVHCTDKKRETIYIKDANKWEKDEERQLMHKMIKKVADKNARLLPKFTEKYPDYKNYHSKNSDKYSKIIVESMGGSGDNDYEKEEKIIKNIAKTILVEK
jgi:hypothetical protein